MRVSSNELFSTLKKRRNLTWHPAVKHQRSAAKTTNSNCCDRAVAQVKQQQPGCTWKNSNEQISKKGIKLILKIIGNRKGDCAWSCLRWQTQPEKICKLQSTSQYSVRSEWYWFVRCDLQISGCVCHLEQLHALSPFLFPIVFSIIYVYVCMYVFASTSSSEDFHTNKLKVARNEVENASFAQRSAHCDSRIWRPELIEPAAERKRRARGRRPTFKSAYPDPQILPQCNISSNYPL